jgi:hypothetical protein
MRSEPNQPSPEQIRASIIGAALADVEARLRAVRCPIDGRPLSRVRVARGVGQPLDLEGCCGAIAEARRALQD